jgi:uncharacterized membrane protein YdjX (TVP38/TMEM64 family)
MKRILQGRTRQMTSPDDSPPTTHHQSRIPIGRLLVFAGVVLAAGIVYLQFGDQLDLDSLAQRELQLRTWKSDHPILVYAVAVLVYVSITGLSLPGALILTLVYAWYFDFVPALIVVSFSSTAGATLAFLFSRYLLRDSIQSRFGDRLQKVNEAFEREGGFYLFTMRLIPAIPFFTINLLMGLTSIRVVTYWWISQLGMLPGTAVYVYAGSSVPDLNTLKEKGTAGILSPELIAAFVLLGVFPIVVKKVTERFRPSQALQDSAVE